MTSIDSEILHVITTIAVWIYSSLLILAFQWYEQPTCPNEMFQAHIIFLWMSCILTGEELRILILNRINLNLQIHSFKGRRKTLSLHYWIEFHSNRDAESDEEPACAA